MSRFAVILPFCALTIAAQSSPLTDKFCATCHSASMKAGGLVLTGLNIAKAGDDAPVWEKVLRAVKTGQMPPPGLPRPNAAAVDTFAKDLAATLDRAALTKPNPGAPMPHRLNRVEYSNAIRDLLALDTQPGLQLPVDESGFGFDNMADLLSMSPSLLERYLSVARTVTRQAIGDMSMLPEVATYGSIVRSQRKAPSTEEVPVGAANGMAFRHYFPLDAEYEIRVDLAGTTGEGAPPTPFQLKLPIKAGMHHIAVTFLRETPKPEVALRTFGRAFGAPPGMPAEKPGEMDLRIDGASVKRWKAPQRGVAPDVALTKIEGPFKPTGPGSTPSREKIFTCKTQDDACANTILTNLAERAFRRPVTTSDVRPLMGFYKSGANFEAGIANALQALLVSPDFLFRIERDPKGVAPATNYKLNDYEVASRLSFFIWSSLPDDELMALAAQGKLRDNAVLKTQLRRMIEDPKSDALIRNFGGQWLFLRTLANTKPDSDIFATFDENLRAGFQKETELFLANIFRNQRSVLELLDAKYTYLNQQLAEHYGVRGVYGPHFRRVELPDRNRGGLLGQGSILTVTSYPNRTSVVQRGKWILENLLGTPPPPPPADVPELQAKNKEGRKLSLREAMELHRSNAVCASCHGRMDPIGFALENFDGVGAWRADDSGVPVDAKGKLPNGAEFEGPGGLKSLLLEKHRDEFVHTVVEKLMTYALGRGLEARDKPTVRMIARKAAAEDYRMSAFLDAIVESPQFQMRRSSGK